MTADDPARHLLPMPKRVRVEGWRRRRSDEIAVSAQHAHPLVGLAAEELAAFISANTGVQAAAPGADASLRIALDCGAAPDQPATGHHGYCIVPDERGLRLTGCEPIGAFYAMKTLKQALRFGPGTVEVPLLRVADSADMAERGFWDYFHPCPTRDWSEMHTLQTAEAWRGFIDDLTDFKINLMELLVWDEGLYYDSARFPALVQPGVPEGKNELIREVLDYARARGIACLPATCHPEHFHRLMERDPEYRARSPSGVQPSLHPHLFCFSHPGVRETLAGIVEEIGELFEPDGIVIWLPENLGQCNCDECRQRGYLRQFISIFEEPFERLRGRRAGLRKRFLASFMHYSDNVLRILPEDAEIEYYECDRRGMYTCDERKSLSPVVAAAARSGRRVVGCTNFRGAGLKCVPLPYLDTVAEWIELMHRDAYWGVSGSLYSNPGVCRLNLLRMADATWRRGVRDSGAFALAYAVRHGGDKPALRATVIRTLSECWDFHQARHGDMALAGALDWIISRDGPNIIDCTYVVDALEDVDLPRLQRHVSSLTQAAEWAQVLADDSLTAQVESCRIRVAAMLHCFSALHVYGRQQWPDPEKGPWLDWIEEILRHAREARELLLRLPEVTAKVRSEWPGTAGDPAASADRVIKRLDRILDPAFRTTLEERAWPDLSRLA